MSTRHSPTLLALALGSVATLGLVGCSDSGGGSGSNSTETRRVQLEVTDAPVDDLSAVTVQFTGVVFNPADDLDGTDDDATEEDNGPPENAGNGNGGNAGAVDDDDDDAGEGDNDFIRFTFDTPRQIDLLALTGGRTDILIDEAIPTGRYEWIRLEVDAERGMLDSFVTRKDGGQVSLFIPSGAQRGLQLNGPFEISANQGARYVVDFDLRKSIKNPQGFSDYLMRPTLRIVEVSEAGSIAGSVDSSRLAAEECTADPATGDGAAIYVYDDTSAAPDDLGSANAPMSTATLTLNESTGVFEYTAAFLAPERYRAAFTCQAAGDDNEADDAIVFSEPQNVAVTAGATATADFGPIASEDDGQDTAEPTESASTN
ncbi:DUF4382 domain-containing protein [Algiphilus sp.]|uniref:DUF4382 domain-containing protein n=1 Tax=Algiphilus sp. TaxID=1872431 RepID=UPI003B52D53B